jgi:hypothetical protein
LKNQWITLNYLSNICPQKTSPQIGTNINKYQISSDIQIKGNLTEGKKLEIYRQLFWGKPEKCNGGITAKYRFDRRAVYRIRRNLRAMYGGGMVLQGKNAP